MIPSLCHHPMSLPRVLGFHDSTPVHLSCLCAMHQQSGCSIPKWLAWTAQVMTISGETINSWIVMNRLHSGETIIWNKVDITKVVCRVISTLFQSATWPTRFPNDQNFACFRWRDLPVPASWNRKDPIRTVSGAAGRS